MKRAAPIHHDGGEPEKPSYSPDEVAMVRRRLRLHPEADADAWCAYARAMAVWRHRCATWLACMLASPEAYLRLIGAKSRARPSELREALEVARQQILDLAKPGQRPTELAEEIMGRGNRPLLIEISEAGWLPRRPGSPGTYQAPRRAGITPEQRQRAAEVIAAGL